MNKFSIIRHVFSLVAIMSCGPSWAGSKSGEGIVIDSGKGHSRWSFGSSFAPLLNIDTEFRGLGGFTNPVGAPVIGGGFPYNYDDGFVDEDISGNLGGQTWNWGYDSASQYDSTAFGGLAAINLSTSSAVAAGADKDGETAPGIDLFAYYDMGAVSGLNIGSSGKPRWGFRAGLHLAGAEIDDNAALGTGLATTTDSFSLTGPAPPLVPHSGSFGGPGALIFDTPVRSTSSLPGGAIVTGSRELDLFLTTFSVGPYLELPLGNRVSIYVEAGLNLAIANGEYDQRSVTTIPGVGSQTSQSSGDETDLLPGFYLGASLSYAISDHWSLFGSARYQYLDDFEVRAGNSEAEISFSGAVLLSLGGTYRF